MSHSPPPWLRPWPEVRALYAEHQRMKERIERAAIAAGIRCRLRKEKPPCS